MMAMRLISSEIPCRNRSVKASGIRNFAGHCGRPPAVGRLLVLQERRTKNGQRRDKQTMPHRQQEEQVPDDLDRVARRAGQRVVHDVDADVLVEGSVHGAASRNTAPNSNHCISSQALELMSNILRTMALPALMMRGDRRSATPPTGRSRACAASIQRLTASRYGDASFPLDASAAH